ncbi:MAG: DNA cytosine methyltransferase [Chloroflexia bacterium]
MADEDVLSSRRGAELLTIPTTFGLTEYSVLGYNAAMKKPTLVDLFCGAGGMSHGFEQAGFSVLAGVDSDKDSIATFRMNHIGSRAIQADLTEIRPDKLADLINIQRGSLDCLVGGPPCQGFSRNRAITHENGEFIDDERNYLYRYFLECVAYFQPKVVVIENVPEILIRNNKSFYSEVFERFENLKYHAEARVLNAADYGVPQHRRRAFILAGREGQPVPFPEPTTLPGPRAGYRTPNSPKFVGSAAYAQSMFSHLPIGPTVWEAISDLYRQYSDTIDGNCQYASAPDSTYQKARRNGNSEVANHFPWRLTETQLRRIQLLGQGQGLLHLPEELKTKNGYGSAYRRLQADAQALTITTWMFHPGSGMFTHPYEDRIITVREAARLQSFQDSFVFSGKYHSMCRQVGNSVAPLVALNIGKALLPLFGYSVEGNSLQTAACYGTVTLRSE